MPTCAHACHACLQWIFVASSLYEESLSPSQLGEMLMRWHADTATAASQGNAVPWPRKQVLITEDAIVITES
eukprot:354957-Chlamydomonas_euryale.AAC.3